VSAGPEWGPLARLAGIWEGEKGEDVAYANDKAEIGLTPYREHIDFKPFGPVENGSQVLYGLDYRMAAWRGEEDSPFHTEVGYWMWDARDSEIVRCFLIPRGSAIVAGAVVGADDTKFTLHASVGSQTYGILSNNWLDKNAQAIRYEVTIDTSVEDEFSYTETTVIKHARLPEEVIHTDLNTLRKIADA
jgi:hypothetical protein